MKKLLRVVILMLVCGLGFSTMATAKECFKFVVDARGNVQQVKFECPDKTRRIPLPSLVSIPSPSQPQPK
jgi:hypothetical protein